MFVETLFMLATVQRQVSGQPLYITGFGVVKSGIYFLELFASEPIPDLSGYTVSTETIYRLPSTSVPVGYILFSNKGLTNEFFGDVYNSYFGDKKTTDIYLRNGNDGIALISNVSGVIDYFGPNKTHTDSSCRCSYKWGWGKRRLLKYGDGYKYDSSDWTLTTLSLDNCKGKTNKRCRRPFPVKNDTEGYLKVPSEC